MTDLDIGKTTTTDLGAAVKDYSVDAQVPDSAGEQKETVWGYPDVADDYGYFNSIPEFNQAVLGLNLWTIGKGYTIEDKRMELRLDNITGIGFDTFSLVLSNIFIQEVALGDGMGEIIRNDNGTLINLKPLWLGDMRSVFGPDGTLTRYEQRKKNGIKKLRPEQILHLCNNRVGNSMHGIRIIKVIKWIVDARNEALADLRLILHRMRALGVVEFDTEDTAKIDSAITQVEKAIKTGDILGYPKGVMELKDFAMSRPPIREVLEYIRYLEDFFHKAVGVPKIVLGGSEQFTNVDNKMGYLTFEQVYSARQKELENQLWNQMAIKLKFNKPVGLKDEIQQSEARNTGQVGIQPNVTQVDTVRSE